MSTGDHVQNQEAFLKDWYDTKHKKSSDLLATAATSFSRLRSNMQLGKRIDPLTFNFRNDDWVERNGIYWFISTAPLDSSIWEWDAAFKRFWMRYLAINWPVL